jgi:hypothetical protein
MKYEQALKSSECRNAYKTKGHSNEEVVSEVKPKRKYVRKSKVEAPTELPKNPAISPIIMREIICGNIRV